MEGFDYDGHQLLSRFQSVDFGQPLTFPFDSRLHVVAMYTCTTVLVAMRNRSY